jgi:methyltransferase
MTPHARIIGALVLIFALMGLESRRSARNARALRARGAFEPPGDVYAWMKVVYPLAFMVPALEGWFRTAYPREWWLTGLVVFALAKALKYWAVLSLGNRWSFRVLVPPDPSRSRVTHGPYRFMSHPNYTAVAGEIAGAALLVGGPRTGALFTILFGWLMLRRIKVEESAERREKGV